MGFFIPTHGQVASDIVALKKAGAALDKLLEAQHIDVEEVIADFKAARKKATTSTQVRVFARYELVFDQLQVPTPAQCLEKWQWQMSA